jgi:hypothetical protein
MGNEKLLKLSITEGKIDVKCTIQTFKIPYGHSLNVERSTDRNKKSAAKGHAFEVNIEIKMRS